MRFIRPKGVLSGFRVDGPHPAVKELRQFGEHWAPDGWNVQLHAHRQWEVYYQAQGSSQWSCGGLDYKLDSGQAYIVAPEVVHKSLMFSKGAQHFYFAELDLSAWWSRSSPIEAVRSFEVIANAEPLEPVFRMLMAEGGRGHGHRQPRMLRNLLGLVTLQTERLLDRQPPERQGKRLSDAPASVLHAQSLLESNLSHNWKLEELGHLAGISANYLSTTFAKTFGMSPMRYLQNCRVRRARQLLHESNLSITAIAHELGFSSIQHFSMRFKEHTGQTPSQFRKLTGSGLLIKMATPTG